MFKVLIKMTKSIFKYMIGRLTRFYNMALISATALAITGGVVNSDKLISIATALVAAAGTSFQMQVKNPDDATDE